MTPPFLRGSRASGLAILAAVLLGFPAAAAQARPDGSTREYWVAAVPVKWHVVPNERDAIGAQSFRPLMDDSIAGGMYGALSILGPGEEKPDRENVVILGTELGLMTIDGRAFVGNTPVFTAKVGDLVQWDVLAMGDDHHTFHVHGHRWKAPDGADRDTITLGPAESFRIRWREDDPGTWLYHCHVEGHMMLGMIGLYRVSR